MTGSSFSLLSVENFTPLSVSLFRGRKSRCGETFVILQFSASTGNCSVMFFGKLIVVLSTVLG
jgi:hypothetical protein